MARRNLGAVRLPLLAAAVLASFAVPVSAQVVEKGRTFADLTASHPCDTGLTDRIARVTDCDAADDIGDGGGAFQCWAICDGTAPWAAVSIGGGSGGTGDVVGPASATDNAIARYDLTTGKLLQDSAVTIADTTGNLQWEGTTADAFEGNFTFADPTADWTWNWLAAGAMRGPDGTTALPAYGFASDPNTGTYLAGADTLSLTAGGVDAAYVLSSAYSFNVPIWGWEGVSIGTAKQYLFSSVGNPGGAAAAGLRLISAGLVGVSDGSTGAVWLHSDGKEALASDFTNATVTPADLSGLSVTLLAGRKYTFRMALRFSDSTAADGARFDFDGGTATATDFGVNCQVYDSTLLHVIDTTALATDLVATTTTGASSIKCDGSFTVNAAGTFIPRAAQEAHSAGTLTVETGSYIHVVDTSFN